MAGSEEQRLRDAGLKVTRPRMAVLAVLDEAGTRGDHLLVNDIVARTRSRVGAVSLQAVYDCLDVFSRTGLVRRVETAGSPARYETRVGDNHHHLVCRRCGATADVDCATGAAPCLHPSGGHGFTIDEAEVTFWGLCPACSGSPDSAPEPSSR